MQLMMLEAPGTDTGALSRRIAEHFGIPLIGLAASTPEEWTSVLAQELESSGGPNSYLLLVDLRSADQAAELESILDRRDRPLKLVISIDTALAPSLVETRSRYIDVCDYYRQRGLLRRIRSEGSVTDLLATICRIVDDAKRAQLAPDADPFTAKLRSIADAAPTGPASPQPAKPTTTDPVKHPIPTAQESIDSKYGAGQSSGWKRTAEQKGRIRRRASSSKKDSGGRKPGGPPKP